MLPPSVIDVGLTRERGGLVIEPNAAWGSGLNGCELAAAETAWARKFFDALEPQSG